MINLIKKELEALEAQMISVLHLLWIIPICFLLGILSVAFVVSATQNGRESDIYQEGVREGYRMANMQPTLQMHIEKTYDGDIDSFMEAVEGFIYEEMCGGQLALLPINSGMDLLKYKSCKVLSISEDMGKQRPIIKIK